MRKVIIAILFLISTSAFAQFNLSSEVLSRAEKKEKIIIEKFNNIELKNISIE